MRPITLAELPTYSPWVASFLDGKNPGIVDRTPERVEREYAEKYALLRWARTMEEARRIEIGPSRNDQVVASRYDSLFTTTRESALTRSVGVLVDEIKEGYRSHVVDLGCGYGYLLWSLRKALGTNDVFLAGVDASSQAAAVGQKLVKGGSTEFSRFDFNDHRYKALERAYGLQTTVVTSYALHQLPSAAPVLHALSYYRDRINCVINFEPEEDYFGDGVLGRLRRTYGRVNGYSADLQRCLRQRDDVNILKSDPNAFGANALLPATLTVWKFK